MFNYKLTPVEKDVVLAVCDSELIEKVFEEGELILEVRINFYGSDTCDERKLREMCKDATIINAVGKKCISVLIEEGLIDKDKVLRIGGVPHAQMVLL